MLDEVAQVRQWLAEHFGPAPVPDGSYVVPIGADPVPHAVEVVSGRIYVGRPVREPSGGPAAPR